MIRATFLTIELAIIVAVLPVLVPFAVGAWVVGGVG
jgi:hypothetical protein